METAIGLTHNLSLGTYIDSWLLLGYVHIYVKLVVTFEA